MGYKEKIEDIISKTTIKYYKKYLKYHHIKEEHYNRIDLQSLFNELNSTKEQLEGLYKVNLHKSQLSLVEEKEKLNNYDLKVINKIESWLSQLNSSDNPSESLESNGINIENALSAQNIYSEYLNTQKSYIEIEQSVKFYSESYKELKKYQDKIITKIISHYAKLINETIEYYFSLYNLPIEEAFDYCIKGLEDHLKNTPRENPDNIEIIIKNQIKEYCNNKINKEKNIVEENKDTMKEKIIRKLIPMLKTQLPIKEIHNFLTISNINCQEQTVIDIIKELEEIIKTYSDTKDREANKDIELVVKIHDIPTDLALFIFKNKKSIEQSLNKYTKN